MDRKKEHLYYIDVLRIISIIAVLAAHAQFKYVYWCYWSVLMFTAISGAMMLSRDKIDIRRLYLKNIARVISAFLFWSFVYAVISHVFFPLINEDDISPKLVFTSIIEGHFHLWYCYMIVGLFIVSPCLKAIIESSEELGFYLAVIAYFFSILIPALQNIPMLEWTKSITGNIGLSGLKFVFYFVIGYYLIRIDFSARQRKIIYLAGIPVMILYIMFADGYFMLILESGIVVWLFIIAKYCICIENEYVAKAIQTIGDAVFLIYLIHEIFIIMFDRVFGAYVNISGYGFLKFITTLLGSSICAVLIRRSGRIAGYIS